MTRINYGIPVHALSDTLLFAEHREMKRICALYEKGSRTPENAKFTPNGPGHVLFFVSKPNYTMARQIMIEVELRDRGISYTSYLRNWMHAYKDTMHWRDIDKRQVFGQTGFLECEATRTEQLAMASRLLFCIDRAVRDTQPFAGDPVDKENQKAVMTKMLGELDTTDVFKYSQFDRELAEKLPVQPAEYLHCILKNVQPDPSMEPKFEVKVFVWDTREVVGAFECGRFTAHKLIAQKADDNGLALSDTPVVKDIDLTFKHWEYFRATLPEMFMR